MKKNLIAYIGPVVGLIIFSAALLVLHRELSQFRPHDVVREIRAIPASMVALAVLLTVLNYGVFMFYETLGFRYIGKKLSKARIALTSFIASAFSNNIGFMSVSGSAIRYRLYSVCGLSTLDIARMIAFSSILTFWLGLFTISAVVFMVEPVPIPPALHLPFITIRFVGFVFAAALLAYLVLTGTRKKPITVRGWEFEMPQVALSVSLLATACFDWLLFGGVLYVLLPGDHGISFMFFMSVVLVAQLAGMISHVPGGLGIFETVIILLMPDIEISKAVGALVVFRAIYYLMPLCLAVLLFGAEELLRQRKKVTGFALALRQAVLAVMPYFASCLTFLAGVVLQFSGAMPAVDARVKWLELFFPLPVMEVSHLLGSVVGALLLVLSWGIYRRLDAAYHLVLYLFMAGILLSLFKGADYEEALILAFMAVLFLPCREAFYRKTTFLSERFTINWLVGVVLVLVSAAWIGIFSYKHVDYSHELWWQFGFDAQASRFMRASVGGVAVLAILAVIRLFCGARLQSLRPQSADLAKVHAIVTASPHTSAQLALLGDKSFLFSRDGSAFIMYAVQGRSWIAMGDPVGPMEKASELIWDFRELTDTYNGRAVFYEIEVAHLPLYLDMGMTLLKLGEEGRVDLGAFSLEGGSQKGLRHTKSKLEREGCSFEILPPEAVPEHLSRLQEISDSWLTEKHAREKRFSLGCFTAEYIRRFPVAIVRQRGAIVAFTNIWSGAAGSELSIDLMRYISSAPGGVMDYLFINLMEWGKKNRYRWFNLGMAPFSGLEARSLAPVWNRLGAYLFSHGENFYNFQGLRQYKDKFDPVWTPRYLAVPGGLSLPLVLKDISALITGGVKGVITQ